MVLLGLTSHPDVITVWPCFTGTTRLNPPGSRCYEEAHHRFRIRTGLDTARGAKLPDRGCGDQANVGRGDGGRLASLPPGPNANGLGGATIDGVSGASG